jgi:ATP-dependent RNA helicase HelY
MTVVEDFTRLYDFPLDPFQHRACASVEAGREVLVAAPTGAGKTVVGEFAVHLALAVGGKCFYTTPIKALSNQKFADLVRRYGADRVGLLTGDNSINGEAPVVVMTTEVLRNMLYAGSRTLLGLRYVVMDEVHYLADRSRGAVWEEVIIHLPESVTIVALSATVSNAEEFGDWLATVRGDTDVVLEERRPVPLYQHMLVGRHLYDLFADEGASSRVSVNPDLLAAVRRQLRFEQSRGGPSARGGGRSRAGRRPGRPGARGRPRSGFVNRPDVVDSLDRDGLLPAIVFIFSRAGCDAAVEQCRYAHVRLTTAAEQDEIVRIVENRLDGVSDADLDVLGYDGWLESLSRGVAAHHAGLLPVFKECVEALFVRGLVKVVFATETLALGINMPARSVVIEKLTKWNGDMHADMTPGEYTQLTGRAGRRGIDLEGHAVVQWRPDVDISAVAGLASTRTYPLRSSFRPSYNMAVNLVGQVGRAAARTLLESSFAQFQSDRAVVGLARQARRAAELAEALRSAMSCDRGDAAEYARLRSRLVQLETRSRDDRRRQRRDDISATLSTLRVGDVIDIHRGRWAGRAVVVDRGLAGTEPRPLVVTAQRQARRLSVADFAGDVVPVARIKVPAAFNPRNPQQRRTLAAQLRSRTQDVEVASRVGTQATSDDDEINRLRAAVRAHPCDRCPDRREHARAAERLAGAEREASRLEERIEARTNTLGREFDRVCDVLGELGYLAAERLTPAGAALARLYTELDLVAAECLRRGVWDGLGAPALAACLSALVYEARPTETAAAPPPEDADLRMALREMTRVARELMATERSHGVRFVRELDVGFARAAYTWAGGGDLASVLVDLDLAPGDFVRSTRQLIDLCEQVGEAAGESPVRDAAKTAVRSLRRGVVAESVA